MSDKWLSVATISWVDEGGNWIRQPTSATGIQTGSEIIVFFGDITTRIRLVWPAPADTATVPYCVRLQALYPGIRFRYVFLSEGQEMPLEAGVEPPMSIFGC